jgi:hypothetical protein
MRFLLLLGLILNGCGSPESWKCEDCEMESAPLYNPLPNGEENEHSFECPSCGSLYIREKE